MLSVSLLVFSVCSFRCMANKAHSLLFNNYLPIRKILWYTAQTIVHFDTRARK